MCVDISQLQNVVQSVYKPTTCITVHVPAVQALY